MSESKNSDIQIIRRLLNESRPYWSMLAISYLLSLLRTPLILLAPVPVMVAVDSVLSGKPLPAWLASITPDSFEQSTGSLLWLSVFMVVLVALLTQVQSHGSALFKTYLGERLTLDYRARLLRHAQRLSMAYHDEKGTADAIYRVQNDAPAIQNVMVYGLTPILTASLTLASLMVITTQLDWKLAVIAISISPVFVLLTNYFRKRLRVQWKNVKDAETSVLQVVQESLGMLRVVKAFGQEDREHGRFLKQSSKSVWARLRATFGQTAFSSSAAITMSIGTAAVLFVGVGHVQAGILTLGQLLVLLNYVSRLYGPLETLGQQVASLQQAFAGAERTFSLLDRMQDVPEKDDAKPLTEAKGAFEMRQMCFGYDAETPVLENVTLDIPAGKKVGIVGKTGSGKTTLVNLLMRFYDPQSGSLMLDGIDIRDYRIKDLRNQFSIVLQEPVLLSSTIAENISYARPDASELEIIRAAEAAHAHDFIMQLPRGYETKVGERGMSLSGGQRQRISLARAFLKDAPILILDEPTSAVDMETEAGIMEAMAKLMEGRTTFMIAHRLSTLEDCDMIIRLETGGLVNTGAAVQDNNAAVLGS